MNAIVNKVQLIGNIGKAPEIKVLEGGNKMARASVAVTEKYKNKQGEYVKDTSWHNIVLWGGTATNFEKLVGKGTHLAVEGKLVSRSFETKEGERKYLTEVHVNEFMVLKANQQKQS